MAPSGPMVGGTVVVEGRRIASLIGGPAEPPSDVAVIDASGLYVAPGLIDTHTHGLNGSDAMDGEAGVRGMSLGHAERGVTGFLPTLVGQSRDRLTALVAEAASAEVEGRWGPRHPPGRSLSRSLHARNVRSGHVSTI